MKAVLFCLLRLNNPTTPDRWMDRCRDWLISRGYLRTDELRR